MKNLALSIIMLLFYLTAFADIDVTSGSSDFLDEEVTAIVVFDYSKATWQEEVYYEQWCGNDFANRVKLGYGSLIALKPANIYLKINTPLYLVSPPIHGLSFEHYRIKDLNYPDSKEIHKC